VDAVTAQAEDLARTAEQLQDLVARFHAEVGGAVDSDDYDAEYDDDLTDDADEPYIPRRRPGDWAPAETGRGYTSRAS